VSPCSWGRQTYGIVSDPISRADAIVVVGGGLQIRPFVAAELWQRGLADKILISQAPEERAVSIGAMPSHTELNREILLKLGVPAGVIETFGTANRNTRDEAVALREWSERNAASSFIIPTEIFPAWAGATANLKLTFQLDHSAGADHPVPRGCSFTDGVFW
jgi:uncharacterized SAM-binding protein YcdF (DUF218 family)